PRAETPRERADIEPGGHRHADMDQLALAPGDIDSPDRDRNGAQRHRRRLTSQIVGLVSAKTLRGMRGRYLIERAVKGVRRLTELRVIRQSLRRLAERLAVGVVGVGRPAQPDRGFVNLVLT